MESSLVGPNYEEEFKDIVKVVKNWECACISLRDNNCIHQANHDGIYG